MNLKAALPARLTEEDIQIGSTILIQPEWSTDTMRIKINSIDSIWVNGIDVKDHSKFHIKKAMLNTIPFQIVENTLHESNELDVYTDKSKTYKIDSGMGGVFSLKFQGIKNGKYHYKNISPWAKGSKTWDYELSKDDVLKRIKETVINTQSIVDEAIENKLRYSGGKAKVRGLGNDTFMTGDEFKVIGHPNSVRKFQLNFSHNVGIGGDYVEIPLGSIIIFDDEGGDSTFFYYKGKRGSIMYGSLRSMLERKIITPYAAYDRAGNKITEQMENKVNEESDHNFYINKPTKTKWIKGLLDKYHIKYKLDLSKIKTDGKAIFIFPDVETWSQASKHIPQYTPDFSNDKKYIDESKLNDILKKVNEEKTNPDTSINKNKIKSVSLGSVRSDYGGGYALYVTTKDGTKHAIKLSKQELAKIKGSPMQHKDIAQDENMIDFAVKKIHTGYDKVVKESIMSLSNIYKSIETKSSHILKEDDAREKLRLAVQDAAKKHRELKQYWTKKALDRAVRVLNNYDKTKTRKEYNIADIRKIIKSFGLNATIEKSTSIRCYTIPSPNSYKISNENPRDIDFYGISGQTFDEIVKSIEEAGYKIESKSSPSKIMGGGNIASIRIGK